jgi:lipopolysaccharide biosynthesis regulator YciM
MKIITQLTLLLLLAHPFMHAVNINFVAEFRKVEKKEPYAQIASSAERYAYFLCDMAMNLLSKNDIDNAVKACKEALGIKGMSDQVRMLPCQILAELSLALGNYSDAIAYYDLMLAMKELPDFARKAIVLNKKACKDLAEGKEIDQEAYQNELAAIAEEGTAALKAMGLIA